jgi:hypothetical protein
MRCFLNLPAFRTREDVERECERLGVVRAKGYEAIDGLRMMAELPEVAMDSIADEARALERRAERLREQAELVLDSEVQKGTR